MVDMDNWPTTYKGINHILGLELTYGQYENKNYVKR